MLSYLSAARPTELAEILARITIPVLLRDPPDKEHAPFHWHLTC
jgi:hypothetical protein